MSIRRWGLVATGVAIGRFAPARSFDLVVHPKKIGLIPIGRALSSEQHWPREDSPQHRYALRFREGI